MAVIWEGRSLPTSPPESPRGGEMDRRTEAGAGPPAPWGPALGALPWEGPRSLARRPGRRGRPGRAAAQMRGEGPHLLPAGVSPHRPWLTGHCWSPAFTGLPPGHSEAASSGQQRWSVPGESALLSKPRATFSLRTLYPKSYFPHNVASPSFLSTFVSCTFCVIFPPFLPFFLLSPITPHFSPTAFWVHPS